MKKLFYVFISILICISACGCHNTVVDDSLTPEGSVTEMDITSATPSATPTKEYEEIIVDFKVEVICQITEKIGRDTLAAEVLEYHIVDEYGEGMRGRDVIIHIITQEASEWCVGDEISLILDKAQIPYNEEEITKVYPKEITSNEQAFYKPIIYLYPEEPTLCTVNLTLNGNFICTYPKYSENGWKNFTAYPDGTLVFPDGKEYYALYWEAEQAATWDFSKGFCVKGEDTAEFLEWALSEQGLTSREANEFIIYWLPLMQDNPYNVISFQGENYTEIAKLEVYPAPQSVLRVFMVYYPSDTEVEITPQKFEPFERKGFTLVEWGGSYRFR